MFPVANFGVCCYIHGAFFIVNAFFMEQHSYEEIKDAVLTHIQALFQEMENEVAISHQEKYALLEDAFENATDVDELRVAFEQWYGEHAEEVEFEHEVDELWDHAVGRLGE